MDLSDWCEKHRRIYLDAQQTVKPQLTTEDFHELEQAIANLQSKSPVGEDPEKDLIAEQAGIAYQQFRARMDAMDQEMTQDDFDDVDLDTVINEIQNLPEATQDETNNAILATKNSGIFRTYTERRNILENIIDTMRADT